MYCMFRRHIRKPFAGNAPPVLPTHCFSCGTALNPDEVQ